MPNQFEVIDPRGRKVICTEERWTKHILHTRPFMKSWVEEVRTALQNPDRGIYQDAQYADRHIYYRRHKNRPRYIKVVVRFVSPELGEVITAFPTDSPKAGEKLIWPESSL